MNKTAEEACKGSAAKLQWASNVVEQWWNSGGTVAEQCPFFGFGGTRLMRRTSRHILRLSRETGSKGNSGTVFLHVF